MRFIHTADWQIGKPFRNFGEKESVLRQARLAAIETIGRLAKAGGAAHVLVAGDLYDTDAPSQKTLLEPLERMRGFADVAWHVIPGNHDHHRGNGLWDRAAAAGLPANVHVHLSAEPVALAAEAVLLPAPLRRRSEVNDLTEWMDGAESAAGLIRIGLAHGSVTGFGSGSGSEAKNPIAPDRAKRAGLDYLALGDWHRTIEVNAATWYAGTPEADRFDSQEQGQVLLVDIQGAGAAPTVTPLVTGVFRWRRQAEDVAHCEELGALEARLRAGDGLSSLLMRLEVSGSLDLTARAELAQRLAGLEAAMFWLETDLSRLHVRPTAEDLEKIDFQGVLREAAERLEAEAADEALSPALRRRAEDALVQLFVMTRDAKGHAGMKLTHVAVEGCGRFARPARIEGLGPGVNILSAGNEAGKSTLFRAVRTCLFERHNSVKEEIAALATEGLSLPVTITVGFETGGKTYEIRKSFIRSRGASLICEGVERARNAEADEEVWKLLGITPKSARALDEAAYGILWVAQGHSFHTPEPSEGAKSAFNAVTQQEVGTLVGGERARLLLNTVNEELARYLTTTGQPKTKGPLDLAIKESTERNRERIEAETLLEALRQRLDDLDGLRGEFRQVSDPVALQALKDQLSEAQAKLAEAETAADGIRRLEAEELQARQWAAAQQEKLAQLTKQAGEIDAARHRLKTLASDLGPLDTKHADTGKALQETIAARDAREKELEAVEARLAALQRVEAAALRQAKRQEFEARLAVLSALRSDIAANDAALKALSVDAAAIEALDAAEREEARIRAALEAGAARLTISAAPGAGVRLNGGDVTAVAAQPVTEPLTITVGADVSITISPPPEALDAASSALSKARATLAQLLARHGSASAAELRQRRGERIDAENTGRALQAQRAALGLKDWSEIDRLSAAIAGIAAEAQAAQLPSPEDIAAERQSLAERAATLRAQRSSFEAQAGQHREVLTALAAKRGNFAGEIRAIHGQLETALAQLPDATREERLAQAAEEWTKRREAHQATAAALAGERARAPSPEETERRRNRAERYQSALTAQARKAEELRQSIARLEGEVEIAGGQGLGERATTLKLQQEMAAAEAARLGQRVEVLKHLRDTIEGCYARRRAELNAPLLRHLKPFLNDVFPEAELSLGDNFQVSGLNRAAAETFGTLSLGTQEQIAVLVRLAMGAMIAERGEDVPVILDDALVFSDDARIERMFDAISRAGKSQQVIVLTCRARSFASLGGRELRIV